CDEALGPQRLIRPAGAEREEHVAARATGQGSNRAGQEQLRAGGGIGRVGAGHIERAEEAGGQGLAQIVLDQLHRHPAGRRPPAGMASPARPAGVSRTGRARSTTPRLRSSLHTAATIGTGSSASLPTSRAATGSWCAITRSTSLTPADPSASPTAEATSATTT